MIINYLRESLIFILSFCFGILLITYLLQIPHIVTGNTKIVNEYYLKNFTTNIPLDLFFVLIYILIGTLFIKLLKLKEKYQKVLTIGITTAILTTGFCFYFISNKKTSNFFSQWFHTVRYSSVIYDVILLVFIYLTYLYLDEKIN